MRLIWQASIALLVLLGVFWAVDSAVRPANGDPGFSARAIAGKLTVDSVDAGSDAANAGLRVGQTIQVEKSLDELVSWATLRAGDTITLIRGNGSHVTLVARL